jgi:CRP-like cAMP-binding protein
MASRWVEALAGVPVFASVPKRQLRRIAKLAREVRVRAGAPVVLRKQPGREFFVILEGSAVARAADGAEHPLGPGAFFGEMAVIDGGPRSAAVVAESDMVLMMLGRRDFLRVLQEQPSVALAVLTELAGRVRRLEADQAGGATPRS